MAARRATNHGSVPDAPVEDRSGTLGLAILLWLCLLPFVALVLGPILGTRGVAGVAAGLFVVLLGICWGVCAERRPVS
ncbi:MAG: hypothetical protein HYV08_16410 [Deltaproteobacteria bacterium]|nr:hypothetical protein [Deltaproteobacteria bacterium]MBI3079334.1 hypothetical protein [Deltaproteobacteria bacterium]